VSGRSRPVRTDPPADAAANRPPSWRRADEGEPPPALVEIADGRLLLVPWRDEDAAEVVAFAADPELARFSSVGLVGSPEQARDWIRSRRAVGRLDWAVRDASTGGLIGRVGLMNLHVADHEAEIGYATAAKSRGRGVATQAVAVVSRYAFQTLGRHRLQIRHEPSNLASCAVAVKAGFRVEGVLRDAHANGSGFEDLEVHGRLATDPEPGRAAGSPAAPSTAGWTST